MAVESLLADVKAHGVGKRYLIQHSAGSGKSNSIAWLAHQLTGLEDAQGNLLVDSIIVVTDRVILDKQIRDTIRQFAQVGKLVAWAESSGDLRKAIEDGRRIIITTIEKFPYVLPEISEDHKDRHFAIIIDEAHSSQNGKTAGKMNMTLSAIMADRDMDNEDKINAMCEGKKLLTNASYFAFTATPKNKTLETFGTLVVDAYGNPVFNEKGEVQHRPFHVYTMKQAIEEGFILDVLKYYTPIDSYYRLIKTVEDDPMFDKKKAQKKLRAFVESQAFTIAEKADMMVSHFHEQVIAKGKIGGQARAMIITSSIERCIDYYHAVNKCLANRRSPYKAIIAFSGEKQLDKDQPPVTSSGLNGFADAAIPKTFKKDPYRFLIVADMFQTGYDEPLLHTMYVDKMLYDIKAVQTLSRLNRGVPKEVRYLRAGLFQRSERYHRILLPVLQDHAAVRRNRSEQAVRPDCRNGDGPGIHERTGGTSSRPVFGRRGPRPAGPGAGCVRGPVQAAGHGQADQVQERRKGFRAHLRVPERYPALRKPGVGKAVDLPEHADSQTTLPAGG